MSNQALFRLADAASFAEVAERSTVAGYLQQFVRVGPQKVWRRQYTALAPSESGRGLCLYFFSEPAAGGVLSSLIRKPSVTTKSSDDARATTVKLKSELELEQGCEVRALRSEDAPGNKENCFMLITSKTQLKFQASTATERDKWVSTLTSEFEKVVEVTLIEQKAKMLRKGALITWHRPSKYGGSIPVKVSIDDGGFVSVGDCAPIHLNAVETVLPGTESDELRALEDSIYHFNCFVIRLKTPISTFFPDCGTLDFEAPKQSTRDDWVSALEARIKLEVAGQPVPQPVLASPRSPPPSRGLSVAGSGPKIQPAVTQKSTTNTTGTIERMPSDKATGLISSSDSSRMLGIDGHATSLSDSTKMRSMTTSVGGDDEENDEPESKQIGGGVGELFKQKVKLGAGFPYSKCVCYALEMSLQGEKAGSTLTPDRDISQAEADDVTHFNKLELPLTNDDIKIAAQAKKKPRKTVFDMTEYAPSAFKELRNRWGITDLAFYKSLSQLSGDGAVGDGKSGMLFFFTRDRRYVLKTVKTNEMAVLVEKGLLRAYIKHMAENPDSLICRFFGLYSFKMGKPAREIILVCMQNSFDTRLVLHEKYDLKGSTRSRWCTPRFGSVLKDLNFGNSKLYLDASDRADFLKQCERDTALFEQFNVMDYSLLLGVHKPLESAEKVNRNLLLLQMAHQLEQRSSGPVAWQRGRMSSVASNGSSSLPGKIQSPHPKATRWQRDFGGLEGRNPETNSPQVYIMQIIDILQAYDAGKKAENFIKSQMTEEVNEISSVNPKSYRARFLAYMAKITVPVDGQNAMIQASKRDLKLRLFNTAEKSAMLDSASQARQRTATKATLTPVEEEKTPDVAPVLMAPVKQQPPPLPTKRPSVAPVSSKVSLEGQPAPIQPRPSLVADPRARESSFAQTFREEDDIVDFKNETDLKAEIAAAVAAAEQEKMIASAAGEDLGGAYTEVLEDGTEIVILEDGGFIQRMTDGIVIRKFPDGSTRQTNPDGSTIDVSSDGMMTCKLPDGTEIVHVNGDEANILDIQRNPDGSMIETLRDGSTVQKNSDGSRIEIAPNGDKRTVFPDGTIIEQLKGGAIRQFNPDGTSIVSLSDGTRVQTDSRFPHIVLTIYPDGSQLQEDKAEGITIRTESSGVELHHFPDGSKIKREPDGHSLQTNADGVVIETFPDGRKIQRNKDGTNLRLA